MTGKHATGVEYRVFRIIWIVASYVRPRRVLGQPLINWAWRHMIPAEHRA